MVFKATGQLIDFRRTKLPKGAVIEAVMHEGWLGKNHKILIKLDKKFTDDVIKNLNYTEKPEELSPEMELVGGRNPRYIGNKHLMEHKIKIIIE